MAASGQQQSFVSLSLDRLVSAKSGRLIMVANNTRGAGSYHSGRIHFQDSDSIIQAVGDGGRPETPACGQRKSAKYEATNGGAGDPRWSLVRVDKTEDDCLKNKRNCQGLSPVAQRIRNSTH